MRPQVLCLFLLLVSGTLAKHRSNHREDEEEDNFPSNHRRKHLKDEETVVDDDYQEELDENKLPILPPIILLDFVKGNENSSDPSNQNEDKPKRTIDGNLGYGFDKNNFFNGKHNFYLPDGKSGTAVSIEESLSPFEPATITEEIKPITEKNESEVDKESKKPYLEALPDPLPLQKEQEDLPVYPPYPVYGQRTKLHKTSSTNFGPQRRPNLKPYSSTYSTMPTPSADSFITFTTPKPSSYQSSSNYVKSANLNSYARPIVSSYLPDHSQVGITDDKSTFDLTPSQSSSPNHNKFLNLGSYPRYTVENGIKYEHKIVWKYPDGKVSDTPPQSFSNSYSQLPAQESIKTETTGGFRPSPPFYPNPMYQQYQNPPVSDINSYIKAQNNINSPKPIQFPNDAEPSNMNSAKEQTPFVSVSGDNNNQNENYYNPVNYQEQYGQRQKPLSHIQATNKNQYNGYSINHRPLYKYPTNSPSVEYSYQDMKQSGNLFTTNGQLNKQVLAKYTPEVQTYLTKVFSGAPKHVPKTEYPTQTENYVNTDYSNLLSYNPSISQYVKNPSSILQAQPTFIQAGNSLVPVIILRVDGAPPIHPKPGANINLKSLLRQYLSHYASSVSKATQSTNYNFGTIDDVPPDANPVEDLRHLTETLNSLRKKGYHDSDFHLNHSRQTIQSQTHVNPPKTTPQLVTSYNMFVKDYEKLRAQQAQVAKKPVQKVKNVQIIEDPRYTAYKINK